MNRTVIFLLLGWTAIFGPAVACSRDNNMKTPDPETGISSQQQRDTSGSDHTYLALGDSYTIATSIPLAGSYPLQTVQQLKTMGIYFSAPDIIATNGWTTTNLLAALAAKIPAKTYDMVTLLIGVNNQYQGGSIDNYRDQFTELLEKSISYAGNRPAHVVVLSIPDYSVTPFGRGRDQAAVAGEVDAFNKVNKEISLAHGAQYLNITDETRAAGSNTVLLAPDGLHYAAEEYTLWTTGLAPLFRSALFP